MSFTYVELGYCWNETGDCIRDPRALDANRPIRVPNGIQHSSQVDCATMSRVCSQPFRTDRQPAMPKMQIEYISNFYFIVRMSLRSSSGLLFQTDGLERLCLVQFSTIGEKSSRDNFATQRTIKTIHISIGWVQITRYILFWNFSRIFKTTKWITI